MKTADYKKWLAKNKAHEINTIFDPSEPQTPGIYADAQKPANWKRHRKYNVGSTVDQEGSEGMDGGGGANYCDNAALVGGVVREFFLKGSEEVQDGVRYALIELGGQIVHCEHIGD